MGKTFLYQRHRITNDTLNAAIESRRVCQRFYQALKNWDFLESRHQNEQNFTFILLLSLLQPSEKPAMGDSDWQNKIEIVF